MDSLRNRTYKYRKVTRPPRRVRRTSAGVYASGTNASVDDGKDATSHASGSRGVGGGSVNGLSRDSTAGREGTDDGGEVDCGKRRSVSKQRERKERKKTTHSTLPTR